MSDFNAWPSTVGTDGWGFKARRPKATIYGPPRGSAASRSLFGANPYTATEAQYANRQMFGFRGSGAYRRGRVGARRRIRRLRSGRMRLKTGRGGYFDNMFNFGTISQGTGHAGNLSAGMGDYTVPGLGTVDNAIVGAGFSSAGIPQFAPHESSGVFSKVEFLQSIYAPQVAGAFQNTVLPLQPGLQQTFPWLALVAPQFEEYEFLQLMFYWRPMVSDFNSGTGQTGEIVMVTQYNPNDPPFTDTLRAKSYDMAMSCKASLSMNHGVECDPTKNSGAAGKYIRTGPLVNEGMGTDIKQYDLGNLNVIVTGTPSAYSGQLLGELWVAYTVCLRKPKLPNSTGDVILRDYFSCQEIEQTPIAGLPGQFSGLPLIEWPSKPIAYGAQNRINDIGSGLTLTSEPTSNDLIFNYTVPTWYTGQLEIKITVVAPSLNVNVVLPAQSVLSPFYALVLNNCALIPDMGTLKLITPPSASFPNAAFQNTGGLYSDIVSHSLNMTTYTCVFHVDFKQPTSGIGQIEIVFDSTGFAKNAAGQQEIAGWTFDASEYNTSFVSPDGNGVAIVTASGQGLPTPWTGGTTA